MPKLLDAAASQFNLASLGCLDELGSGFAVLDPYYCAVLFAGGADRFFLLLAHFKRLSR